MEDLLVSVDIGTTTIRACLFGENLRLIKSANEKVDVQISGKEENGLRVEMGPIDICEQFIRVVNEVLQDVPSEKPAKIAICCQRNSFLYWDKQTLQPLTKIVCWNDGRALKTCDEWNNSKILASLHAVGAIMHWITRKPRFCGARMLKFLSAMVSHRAIVTIEQSEELKKKYKSKELGFGCLETWLICHLSDGLHFVADASNASSTGMFDPYIGDYNFTVLRLIGFPVDLLPPLVDSAGGQPIPLARKYFNRDVSIIGMLADQQSALFGAGCWKKFDVKISLGTGLFIDMNTGSTPHASMNGLYPLVAWRENGKDTFAAEGNDHDTATILQWAQSIGLFDDVSTISELAEEVKDSHGVLFVPAFGGLQTPINDNNACCSFMGLKPDSTKNHMVTAILEAISFRAHQIVLTLKMEFNLKRLETIRICGGVSQNDFICQAIADLVQQPVERLSDPGNVGCRGATLLAGLHQGKWTRDELPSLISVDRIFIPSKERSEILLKTYQLWLKAVQRCRDFYE